MFVFVKRRHKCSWKKKGGREKYRENVNEYYFTSVKYRQKCSLGKKIETERERELE